MTATPVFGGFTGPRTRPRVVGRDCCMIASASAGERLGIGCGLVTCEEDVIGCGTVPPDVSGVALGAVALVALVVGSPLPRVQLVVQPNAASDAVSVNARTLLFRLILRMCSPSNEARLRLLFRAIPMPVARQPLLCVNACPCLISTRVAALCEPR